MDATSLQHLLSSAGIDAKTFHVLAEVDGRPVHAVTVHGSDDGPSLTTGTLTGSVTEAGTGVTGTAVATGDVNVTDADDTAFTFSGSAGGTYGTFSIDTASGVWTYTLDNARTATEALDTGETRIETFTVTVSDDVGATTSTVVVCCSSSTGGPSVTMSVFTSPTPRSSSTPSRRSAARRPSASPTSATCVAPTSPVRLRWA